MAVIHRGDVGRAQADVDVLLLEVDVPEVEVDVLDVLELDVDDGAPAESVLELLLDPASGFFAASALEPEPLDVEPDRESLR